MFDVLVYVFENYLPGACPGPDALARRLAAAGFEDDEISAALNWLAGLEQAHEDGSLQRLPEAKGMRVYCPTEVNKLPADCRGLLAYLEGERAIDVTAREMIVERAMAVDAAVVSLAKFKVIVLMVMWRRQLALDHLVFEDMLAEDEDLPALMH
jgi:Smg protein